MDGILHCRFGLGTCRRKSYVRLHRPKPRMALASLGIRFGCFNTNYRFVLFLLVSILSQFSFSPVKPNITGDMTSKTARQKRRSPPSRKKRSRHHPTERVPKRRLRAHPTEKAQQKRRPSPTQRAPFQRRHSSRNSNLGPKSTPTPASSTCSSDPGLLLCTQPSSLDFSHSQRLLLGLSVTSIPLHLFSKLHPIL